jgi:DNA adenine methylase
LVPLLKEIWLPYQDSTLVEPFTGGMAVALGLNPSSAFLNDANVHLINFYQQVSKGLYHSQSFKNNAEFYYQMRDKFNELIHRKQHRNKEAAILFYFLIRTGFNGLCRFNSKGEFNVPFGSHKTIRYKIDFLEYQHTLKKWKFSQQDFEKLKLQGDEFLYADPPYDVEFTQYQAKGFDWEDQKRLTAWLSKHSGQVVVSNQATPRILKLYREYHFTVFTLPGPRRISCNGDRKPAMEMLALKGFKKSDIKKLKERL